MAYRELKLSSSPTLRIDDVDYDVDYFGMDDGRSEDPNAALRFLFQLGYGYMIHLYVIQAGSRGAPRGFFHTTWIKDCAVAEVEMEDTGAPDRVEVSELVLPLIYDSVEIGGARHAIASQTFRARGPQRSEDPGSSRGRSPLDESGSTLEMTFELGSERSKLVWSRERRWELVTGERRRVLEDSEWPRFGARD